MVESDQTLPECNEVKFISIYCKILFSAAFSFGLNFSIPDYSRLCLKSQCFHKAAGLILGLRPANERRRYKVTPSLIGWAQTWKQPWAVSGELTIWHIVFKFIYDHCGQENTSHTTHWSTNENTCDAPCISMDGQLQVQYTRAHDTVGQTLKGCKTCTNKQKTSYQWVSARTT